MRALDGVSFDLRPGEIHALCGENGAGKSTLIKVLCGYHPAGTYGGEVRLSGAPVRFASIRDAERHGIALIAQELALVPELSVAENLSLGREPVRAGLIRWDAVRERARSALLRVGLPVDTDRPVKELGIGQQQMVEIAKALSKDARLLVLDEPTAALTEADADRLLRLLGRAAREGRLLDLHQPPPGGGLPGRRPHHRAARRPHRRHRAARRGHPRPRHRAHGRTRGERALPAASPPAEGAPPRGVGMVGGGSLEPRTAGGEGRLLRGRRGRDPRPRRPHGRGTHRPRELALRRRPEPRHGPPPGGGGTRARAVPLPRGGDRGRAVPGERGPQALRPRARGLGGREPHPGQPAAIPPPPPPRRCRARGRRGAGGGGAAHQDARPGNARASSSRAATSRRSCSASGCSPGRACSSWTSPRGAWTWARRRRSTGSSPTSRRRGGASCSCPPSCRSCSGMSHRVIVLSQGVATARLGSEEATAEAVMAAATVVP